MLLFLIKLRRLILKCIVPEFVWPENVTLDDVLIPVRHMPYSFGVKRILTTGNYETSERCLLAKALRNGDVIFEFGGSIAILATIASAKVGNRGFVVSVEASALLTNHSKKRLSSMQNVVILNGLGFPVVAVPVSFERGVFVDEGNSLGGRVEFSTSVKSTENSPVNYDLTRISMECGREPDILLIDIEGSETVFLEVGVDVSPSVRNIIIELHPGMYGFMTEASIISAICSFGFHVMEEISHVYLLERTTMVSN